MPINVEYAPDQSLAAIIAFLSAAKQQQQAAAPPLDQIRQALGAKSSPNGLVGAQQLPVQPPNGGRPISGGKAPKAYSSSFSGGGHRGQNYDPNKSYASIINQQIKSNAELQRTAMEQDAISRRAMQETSLKAAADEYDYWSKQKPQDEVIVAVRQGHAKYSQKQMDERNKLLDSISEAQASPNLTDQQKFHFMATQRRKVWEIDNNPQPVPPDQWPTTPDEELNQSTVIHRDDVTGLNIPMQRRTRNGESYYEATDNGKAMLEDWKERRKEQYKAKYGAPEKAAKTAKEHDARIDSIVTRRQGMMEKITKHRQAVMKAKKMADDAAKAFDDLYEPSKAILDDPASTPEQVRQAYKDMARARQKMEDANEEYKTTQAELEVYQHDYAGVTDEEAAARGDQQRGMEQAASPASAPTSSQERSDLNTPVPVTSTDQITTLKPRQKFVWQGDPSIMPVGQTGTRN